MEGKLKFVVPGRKEGNKFVLEEITNYILKNLESGSQLEAELRKIYENEGFIDIPESAERLGTTKTKIRELISKMGLDL